MATNNTSMGRGPMILGGVLAGILIFTILIGSWYTIDQGERGVRLRNGAVVGRSTAQRFQWKVGDRIPLQSPIWGTPEGQAQWEFEIVGFYDGAKKGTDTTQMFFRYDYFEEARQRAELASAFLGAELGIRHDLEQHATYLERYLGLLRGDNREIFRASQDAQAIADLILDRHPTWQLEDGVCARRTEPLAEVSAETAPATDRTPEAAPATETGERAATGRATETPEPRRAASPALAAALPAPYHWALAALSDPETDRGDDPLDGLSRRIDAALPLAEVLRAGDAAERPPVRPDSRALSAAHHP